MLPSTGQALPSISVKFVFSLEKFIGSLAYSLDNTTMFLAEMSIALFFLSELL